MPIWINDNQIKGELSEEQFLHKVRDLMLCRIDKETKESKPGNYGNDGIVEIYREEVVYKDIRFNIIVLRYFAVNREKNGSISLWQGKVINKIGKHVVVEGFSKLSSTLENLLDLYDFLWHDSLHSFMEDLTLKEQWSLMLKLAKKDIDKLIDVPTLFECKVEELKQELEKWITSLKVTKNDTI